MTYSEKLKTPNWQRKRLSIFERDNWRCVKCQSVQRELQVHHLDYIDGIEPWDYPNDMLITLCVDCHAKEKNRENLELHLSNTLKMKGFLLGDLLALSCLIDTNEKFTESLIKILRANE